MRRLASASAHLACRPVKTILLLLCAIIVWLNATSIRAESFPPITLLKPGIDQSRKLQRTLNLLQKSTSERPNTVRILFFGQTMAQPTWFTNLIDSLRKDYPHANIIAENRALDSHVAEQLFRYAESELYPRRPDLVIYSAMGHGGFITKQLEEIRRRTSADLLLFTEPLRKTDRLDEPTDPKVIVRDPSTFRVTPENYIPWQNNVFLPKIATDFETAFIDVRSAWKTYLRENHLTPDRLLQDNARLTPHGHHLLASLIRPWLAPGLWNGPYELWDNDQVLTYQIPRDAQWKGNQLRIEFLGNRVELVLKDKVTSRVTVSIDGKPPSEIPELRIAGRGSHLPGTAWPALLRVGSAAPLLDETWTAKIFEVSTNEAKEVRFKFSLTGSKTGPDGEGTSEFDFISKSHRVDIEKADWNLQYLHQKLKVPLPGEFVVQWPVLELGRDVVDPETKPETPKEDSIPIAVGLKQQRHVLVLTMDGNSPPNWLQSVRIYKSRWSK